MKKIVLVVLLALIPFHWACNKLRTPVSAGHPAPINTSSPVYSTLNNTAFSTPSGICMDTHGNVFVADRGNGNILKINTAGQATTVASGFNAPRAVAVAANGDVFVADTYNYQVVKISGGVQTTILNGHLSGKVAYIYPMGLTFDQNGNLYVADTYGMIWKVTLAGVISEFAGTDSTGAGDGPVHTASFNIPHGIAFDKTGALYVADTFNNSIRKIAYGMVSTFVSSGLYKPWALSFDEKGNLYISNESGGRVDLVSPSGTVTQVASFCIPRGVVFSNNSLFVTDSCGGGLYKVDLPIFP